MILAKPVVAVPVIFMWDYWKPVLISSHIYSSPPLPYNGGLGHKTPIGIYHSVTRHNIILLQRFIHIFLDNSKVLITNLKSVLLYHFPNLQDSAFILVGGSPWDHPQFRAIDMAWEVTHWPIHKKAGYYWRVQTTMNTMVFTASLPFLVCKWWVALDRA